MPASNRRVPKLVLQKNASAKIYLQSREAVAEVLLPRAPYKLDDLLAKITDENRHDEIVWGAPVGKEAW